MQYKHPLCAVPRYDVGPIDAGAYEYGVVEANGVCADAAEPPPPPPAAPQLQAFTVSSSTVSAGSAFTVAVVLSAPAPSGGVTVALSSSPSGVVTGPSSITVAAGSSTASVTLNAGQVSTSTTVVLTATLGTASLSATVRVDPVKTAPVKAQLLRITASPKQIKLGGSVKLTVDLGDRAPAGGVMVQFTSSKPYVKVPASAVIPAGARSVTVQAQADAAAPNGIVYLQAESSNTVTTYVVIRAAR
jgi:hypothetical protein